MILKYWYWFSLILLIYNLFILYDESNTVHYNRIKEKRKNDSFEASVCFPLASVLELMADEGQAKLNESQSVLVSDLMKLATDSLNEHFGIQLDGIHSYFANNHTCFAVKSSDLHAANYFNEIDFKVSLITSL